MTTQSEFDVVEPIHMLEGNKTEESLNVQLNLQELENTYQYVSENLDSALDSESNESDTTTSTTDKRLSETITYQQKIIEHNAETIKGFEEKVNYLEQIKQELSAKLEQVSS